jgi:hypothetical protein
MRYLQNTDGIILYDPLVILCSLNSFIPKVSNEISVIFLITFTLDAKCFKLNSFTEIIFNVNLNGWFIFRCYIMNNRLSSITWYLSEGFIGWSRWIHWIKDYWKKFFILNFAFDFWFWWSGCINSFNSIWMQ